MTLGDLADKLAELHMAQANRNMAEQREMAAASNPSDADYLRACAGRTLIARKRVDMLRAQVICLCQDRS